MKIKKLVPVLQTTFWATGWFILLAALVNIGFRVYYHFADPIDLSDPFAVPRPEFVLLVQLRVLFTAVAQAFFAFLMSSVFDMIFHGARVDSQRTERFLALTCFGFVGEGIVGLISWAGGLSFVTNAYFAASALFSVIPHFVSFVIAITIYVLYQHFSRLVQFESEVV